MSGAPSKCLLWFNGQKFDHCTCYGALGVNHDIPHTSLNDSVDGVIKGNMVWLVIPFSVLISWMSTSLERVGESTENPFEGNANDVPISQMCRTAEIDLREMLGETDLPPPLAPRNNIVL